jgi:predicted TIM-barrel fold metal-dependent hydrolase
MLDDFAGVNPDRLIGLPMLPIDDGMETALAELDRVVAKGARGLWIPGSPARPIIDPYYEPLWQRADDVAIPLTFHRNHGGNPGDTDWDELIDSGVSAPGIVNRFFSAVRPFTYLTMSGIFDRYPRLRIVAAEVNWGWVPFWAQMMDQGYEVERHWSKLTLQRKPSEYMGTNLFFTGLNDDFGFRHLVGPLSDAAMFSTDYPHSVTLWPNSARYIATLTAALDPVTKHKVLAGNAARTYGL